MTSSTDQEERTYEFEQIKDKTIVLINLIISKNLTQPPLSLEKDELERALNNLSIEISSSLNNPTEIDIIKPIYEQFEEFLKGTISVSGLKKTINAAQTVLSEYLIVRHRLNRTLKKPIIALTHKLELELDSFMRLRGIADNAKTEDIYYNAVIKYTKLEKKYRKYFYRAVAIVLILAILLLMFKSKIMGALEIGDIEFWVLKVSLLAVGVTLISYFIKQSSHYQRLADQNYQTQVELQAYPSFMESIPTNEAASIRKELALKYFGREIDGAAHKDMSNLMSDQMKNSTELVKATTEAIKNLKS